MASSSAAKLKLPSLRERQHEQTRTLILDALVDTLSEDGAFDFSFFELARRANVAVRTVYRHFPDRDALLLAMGDHINRRIGIQDLPNTIDEVPALVRALFRKFDEHPAIIQAQLTTAAGSQVRSIARRERVAKVHQILHDAAPHLDAKTRQTRGALISCLISANSWKRMREEFGMTGAEAGDVIAWGVSLIIAKILHEDRVAAASARTPKKKDRPK